MAAVDMPADAGALGAAGGAKRSMGAAKLSLGASVAGDAPVHKGNVANVAVLDSGPFADFMT